MSDQPTRRPARQRATTDQEPVTSIPIAAPAPTMAVVPEDDHDPGGWLVIGMMVLMIVAVAFITVLAWQAA